jgi:hypothetical protein
MSAIGSKAAVPGFLVWPGNFPAAFGHKRTFKMRDGCDLSLESASVAQPNFSF